jgi:hypothetical protein
MSIELPEALLLQNGQSTLLYDSRTVRHGQKDVVFIFGHPQVKG